MRLIGRKWRKWLLPLCYIAAVLAWLLLALGHFLADRERPEQTLNLAQAQAVQLLADAGVYVTEGADGQWVWETVDQKVRLVHLQAASTLPPGEMELFYTRAAGQPFSVAQRVIGEPVKGGFLYVLPAGQVAALRVDTGTTVQNMWTELQLTLNPSMPASYYFVPTLRTVVALVFWPVVVCVLLENALLLLQWLVDKQKKGADAAAGPPAPL